MTVGIKEPIGAEYIDLKVAPNPSSDGMVRVLPEVNLKLKNVQIVICDAAGKLIYTHLHNELNKEGVIIDLKWLEKGSYFLRLKSDKYVGEAKIILD